MNLAEELKQQRVKHIVSSYRLDGQEPEAFYYYLSQLLAVYPAPLIELALVESLVNNWLRFPTVRGCKFLAQAHEQLKRWEGYAMTVPIELHVASTISPAQFQQITGLDPSPIFGQFEVPPVQPLRS